MVARKNLPTPENISLANRLEIIARPLKGLVPFSQNARTHSKKQIRQIANSLEEFGFTNPVLIDENDRVLAGHGRILAAQLIGYECVPTIRLSGMSEPQMRAYVLADNKLAENAGWDPDILAIEFQFIQSLDVEFDMTITGFSTPEIDLVIGETIDDVDDPPLLPLDPNLPVVTEPGDTWVLDRHRIFCGDATERSSFMALMGTDKAQMVFADPPYNLEVTKVVGRGLTKHREFPMASGEMTDAEFRIFLDRILRNLVAASAEGSIHYVCMDWRHIGGLMAVADTVYTEAKNMCVWDKGRGGMGSLYRSQHELVTVFKNGKAPHINNVELGRHGRNRTNLWQYPAATLGGEADLRLHPTAKPVALVSDAIKDCSHRGGLILDPFGGSGTTLIAAELNGRCARLIELDPLYVDLSIRRWQELTGGAAICATTNRTFNEVSDLAQASPAKKGGTS